MIISFRKKKKSLKNKLSKLESNITKLENQIKLVDLELEINYEQTISDENFFESYHEKKKELSKKYRKLGTFIGGRN